MGAKMRARGKNTIFLDNSKLGCPIQGKLFKYDYCFMR